MNLSDLNEMQQKAVRHTDGPLLIIAGAGSGKTRVLTYRIAYLIEEIGVDPYNILAITFTNKAANEMKERAAAITESGDRVWVSTFHSMCVRILRRFAENIGYTRDFTIYDPDDCKSVMKELFKRHNVDTKYYKEKGVLGSISNAKDNMRSPKDLMIEAEGDFRKKVVAELYADYQKELRKNNAMDFDDLIYNTVELFNTDGEALEVYADRFRYIMVDEYQDTNTSQFMLISQLAKKWNNLCVVGDDDQSIYKFRGANIENILNFEAVFSGAEVIKLEQNYRSTKTILDAANAVIKHNSQRKNKTLWTGNDAGDPISLMLFDNGYQEAEGVASSIRSLEHDGYSYNDIAILYRTNAQSRLLEEKLVVSNIPYRIYGGINFYQRREIKDILAYLKAIVNDADGQSVKRVINVPKRGIGQTTVDRIQVYADENRLTFWEALLEAESIDKIGTAHRKIKTFTDLIFMLREMSDKVSLEELTGTLLDKTGYMDYLAEGASIEELQDRQENIDELINKMVDFEEQMMQPEGEETAGNILGAFLEEVSLVADPGSEGLTETVSLMTLHSAKGLEFPVVFMAGMEDGLFPGYMSVTNMMSDPSDMEEERRLCYVGITRAKSKLYMCYARERMVRGERHTNAISRFVKEIPEAYLDKQNRSFIGDDFGFDQEENSEFDINGASQETVSKPGGYRPRNKSKFDFRKLSEMTKAAYASVGKKAGTQSPGQAPQMAFGKPFTAGGSNDKVVKPSFGKTVTLDELRSMSAKDFKTGTAGKPAGRAGTGSHGTPDKTGQKSSDDGGFEKSDNAPYTKGDRVENERFGQGTVTEVEDMGRDWLITVDFDETGTKKMFAGFIILKKI